MNINVVSLDGIIVNSDGTVNINLMGVRDNRGKYVKQDVVPSCKLYTFCLDKASNQPTSLGVYEIISIVRYTSSKIKTIVLKRLNINNTDDNMPSVPAFICSTTDYIDDIPSGNVIGISDELTECARTYNLLHQPKSYIDVIKVADIVTDTTESDSTKKHHIELKYKPNSKAVQMEINGVSYYEDDDFTVDRDNKIIYFDTSKDDFSFDDLKESTDVIRVFYECVV
jgi:hypothetical protein